jgi:serine/threonine-protein kinase
VPFDGKTFNELLFKIVLSEVPRPSVLAPNLDPAFEAIILKAMAREVSDRFQTCEEFSGALRSYLEGNGVRLPDATGPMPALGVAAQAPHAPVAAHTGLGTGANWSKTDGQLPKKSNAGLVAALLGVGLLVVGGGAFAAYKVMHGSSAAAAASAAVTPPSAVTPPAAVVPSATVKVSEPPTPTAATPPVAETPPEPKPAALAPAAPSVAAKPSAVPIKPAAAHAAVAPRSAAAVKKPSSKPSGGSTDFGY